MAFVMYKYVQSWSAGAAGVDWDLEPWVSSSPRDQASSRSASRRRQASDLIGELKQRQEKLWFSLTCDYLHPHFETCINLSASVCIRVFIFLPCFSTCTDPQSEPQKSWSIGVKASVPVLTVLFDFVRIPAPLYEIGAASGQPQAPNVSAKWLTKQLGWVRDSLRCFKDVLSLDFNSVPLTCYNML